MWLFLARTAARRVGRQHPRPHRRRLAVRQRLHRAVGVAAARRGGARVRQRVHQADPRDSHAAADHLHARPRVLRDQRRRCSRSPSGSHRSSRSTASGRTSGATIVVWFVNFVVGRGLDYVEGGSRRTPPRVSASPLARRARYLPPPGRPPRPGGGVPSRRAGRRPASPSSSPRARAAAGAPSPRRPARRGRGAPCRASGPRACSRSPLLRGRGPRRPGPAALRAAAATPLSLQALVPGSRRRGGVRRRAADSRRGRRSSAARRGRADARRASGGTADSS